MLARVARKNQPASRFNSARPHPTLRVSTNCGIRKTEAKSNHQKVFSSVAKTEFTSGGGNHAGNRTVNFAPAPVSLTTSIVPPCAATIAFAMAKPRPLRPCAVVRAESAR